MSSIGGELKVNISKGQIGSAFITVDWDKLEISLKFEDVDDLEYWRENIIEFNPHADGKKKTIRLNEGNFRNVD